MSDSNLHTCERAALGWQKDGPCKQCELEDNFAKFGGNFGGKPVPSGTQDEREREIREMAKDDHQHPSGVATVRHILSLLDAERKRVQELEGALRKLKSYNEDIRDGKINYRPQDHIQVAESLLSKEQKS